jgi:hypothetical protein
MPSVPASKKACWLDEMPGVVLERTEAVSDVDLASDRLGHGSDELQRVAVAEPGGERRGCVVRASAAEMSSRPSASPVPMLVPER